MRSHEHNTFSHRILVLHFSHFLLLYLIPLFTINFSSFLLCRFQLSSSAPLFSYITREIHSSSLCLFYLGRILHLNISSSAYGSFSSFISFSSSVFSSSFYFSPVFHVHTRTVLHSETIKAGDVRISTQLHRPSA